MNTEYEVIGKAARQRIAARSQAAQATIVHRMAENVRRLRRQPADPVELLTEETLRSLRAINAEVEDAIERIEHAKRQWAATGRPVVVVSGGEAAPGEPESGRGA